MQAERSLLQQAAQTPLDVQNAANLSGGVHSPDEIGRTVRHVLWRLSVTQNKGSGYVGTHPIAALSLPETSTATTATNVPLLVVPIDATIAVSDARPQTRKRGKSMSRRSGQTGSIQKEGNWYVVRFWKDIAGQEKRQRVYERICPAFGPGKLSSSERERKAKEIIAASGVDTVQYFEKSVKSNHGVTFREQAAIWLDRVRNRKRSPIAPATISNWESALDNWVNPNLGDLPLDTVNNQAMKELVAKLVASGKLGPKSISNYAQVVKMVVASAVNEQGEQIYPRRWNHEFIDMPVVDKSKQKTPSFTGDVVSGIVRVSKGLYRMLFILCAAAGLRMGEALGIDIKDISPDCLTIKLQQKAWRGQIHKRLKTKNGEREIDLHPTVADMLKDYIGDRASGLLFCSRTGKQLWQSNILRRGLHPALEKIGWRDEQLGIKKSGSHAFRRFRNTYLRNYTATPEGVYKFWMGHAGEDMSDLYDMIRRDVKFRREQAEKAGIGFTLPSKVAVVGRNGRKRTETPGSRLLASA
jgi:integrase